MTEGEIEKDVQIRNVYAIADQNNTEKNSV